MYKDDSDYARDQACSPPNLRGGRLSTISRALRGPHHPEDEGHRPSLAKQPGRTSGASVVHAELTSYTRLVLSTLQVSSLPLRSWLMRTRSLSCWMRRIETSSYPACHIASSHPRQLRLKASFPGLGNGVRLSSISFRSRSRMASRVTASASSVHRQPLSPP